MMRRIFVRVEATTFDAPGRLGRSLLRPYKLVERRSDWEMRMKRVRTVVLAIVGVGTIALIGGAEVWGQKAAVARGAGGGADRAAAIDMNVVKPETVGFSAERLENLHKLMQGTVDRKELPGAVTILARHGKVVDYRVYGQ